MTPYAKPPGNANETKRYGHWNPTVLALVPRLRNSRVSHPLGVIGTGKQRMANSCGSQIELGASRSGFSVREKGRPKFALLAATIIVSVAAWATAAAAASGKPGHSETQLLAQIVVLLATGRLLGEILQRAGQPAVMGQLLAGVVLGPSVLGVIWPDGERMLFPPSAEQKAMLDGVAQVGVLLLLLLTGMETDLKLVRRVGKASMVVAAAGIAVPFTCGFALGEMLPDSLIPNPQLRLVTSLFLGTSLSISSVKIVAMVVREVDFMRRDLGQVIVAAAIIEDTVGWIIIAIILGIALHGGLDLMALGKTVAGTIAFLAFSFTIGQRIVARLIRWANDTFVGELPVITVILIVMGLMALLTDAIGVHSVLGAFVAGMLIGNSPILTGHIEKELRGLITALFMPVFFAVAGLSADLTILSDGRLLLLTLLLIAIASVGKFGGAFLGGRLAGLGGRQSYAIGAGMNARGSTEVIVASTGLAMGALSQDIYTMIVAMAVLTTLAMPPMLRSALARVPMGEAERERLDREAREAEGFVSRIERLLIAVDGSANGTLAARIAGLIAGPRNIITTVLDLPAPTEPVSHAQRQSAAEVVKTAADAAHTPPSAEKADAGVLERPAEAGTEPAEAVAREAEKGYDLLVTGIGDAFNTNGVATLAITKVAAAFEGPLAIVTARGKHLSGAAPRRFRILLPIRASRHSQRAAEFAIELARASQSPVVTLFVSTEPLVTWQRPSTLIGRIEERAALREVVTLAEQERVDLRTAVQRSESAAEAILRAAQAGDHDLIVLGVSARKSDRLFFGKVATEIARSAPCSVLLIAS